MGWGSNITHVLESIYTGVHELYEIVREERSGEEDYENGELGDTQIFGVETCSFLALRLNCE